VQEHPVSPKQGTIGKSGKEKGRRKRGEKKQNCFFSKTGPEKSC